MNILPNADNAVIPIRKFTEYVLHPVKSRGKSYAFERVLGYNLFNAYKLADNIRRNIKNFEAIPRGDNGFGLKYEIVMRLMGENGRTANVLTGWIVPYDTNETRLTTVYITKKESE